MKTSTWVRDSHELFDYETPHLIKKTFKINTNSGILTREENDLKEQSLTADKGSTDQVLHYNYYNGIFSVFDQPHTHPCMLP